MQVVTDSALSGGKGVSLYDLGDTIQISFTAPTNGFYQIAARVRSGDSWSPVDFWPDGSNGYRFILDETDILLTGDPTSTSALDSSFGKCYWGTMNSAPVNLVAGTHAFVVAAGMDWALADYIQVTPLSLPVVQTFSAWQQANFSVDQLANSTISGYAVMPAGDNIPNLLKFALGLPPWSY